MGMVILLEKARRHNLTIIFPCWDLTSVREQQFCGADPHPSLRHLYYKIRICFRFRILSLCSYLLLKKIMLTTFFYAVDVSEIK